MAYSCTPHLEHRELGLRGLVLLPAGLGLLLQARDRRALLEAEPLLARVLRQVFSSRKQTVGVSPQ
eukprot:SAG22_NODE_246_length_13948_cov_12.055744_2_plen_66_part_00